MSARIVILIVLAHIMIFNVNVSSYVTYPRTKIGIGISPDSFSACVSGYETTVPPSLSCLQPMDQNLTLMTEINRTMHFNISITIGDLLHDVGTKGTLPEVTETTTESGQRHKEKGMECNSYCKSKRLIIKLGIETGKQNGEWKWVRGHCLRIRAHTVLSFISA